jgi:replication initiation and membrane attachment protein DnaB
VFLSDLDDPAFSQEVNIPVLGRKTISVKTDFVYDESFNVIESRSQYKRNIFLKKELKEIERLATLFGLNELTIAEIVLETFDPSKKEERINFSYITKRAKDEARYPFLQKKARGKKSIISSKTQLATKIKLMEAVSPSDYLRIKQNNTTPSSPDLDLVNDLSKHFNLSNGVINALIDYVLTKLNNVLSRPFVEKIAASLAREGVETAVDAMNYLLKVHNGYKKQPKRVVKDQSEVAKNDILIEEVSDQEIEDIVNFIEKKKKAK